MASPTERTAAPGAAPPASRRARRREQPLAIRIAHWCNAVFLILMAGSGLQILSAYPSLGPQGKHAMGGSEYVARRSPEVVGDPPPETRQDMYRNDERPNYRSDDRGNRYDRDGNRVDEPAYRNDNRARPEAIYRNEGNVRYDSDGYRIDDRGFRY